MSTRRFNPFASNASTNTHSDSESAPNARPPTYTSNTTAAPTYTSREPGTTSAHNHNERVGVWSASLRSASSLSSPDSETLFDRTESSLTDTASVAGSSAAITGPRYVYYRVYAEDGAIPSANPVYSDDPYLGRIIATRVAPPHTAKSLRCCLSSIENIHGSIPTQLFIAASSRTAMVDANRVSILAYPGVGCTPSEPLALVATFSDAKRPELQYPVPQEYPTPFETQYIYYRAYKESAAVLSKQPAGSNDPYLGHIRVDSIPPPHTATSIMRCISKVEEFDNSDLKRSQLFASISSELLIGDRHVSILTSDRPGSTSDDPMAFVEVSTPVAVPIPYPGLTRGMRATQGHNYGDCDPTWLKTSPGDVLRTTHTPWRQPFSLRGVIKHISAYQAVNAAGETGFVEASAVLPY